MTVIRPPYTLKTAVTKVGAAEDAWNSRDPHRVALAYSANSEWRNRDQFLRSRDQIREFLTRKWNKELDCRSTKSLWSFTDNRIAVGFQYEYHDVDGQWFRAYGNELWEFDEVDIMQCREASINDVSITLVARCLNHIGIKKKTGCGCGRRKRALNRWGERLLDVVRRP